MSNSIEKRKNFPTPAFNAPVERLTGEIFSVGWLKKTIWW